MQRMLRASEILQVPATSAFSTYPKQVRSEANT